MHAINEDHFKLHFKRNVENLKCAIFKLDVQFLHAKNQFMSKSFFLVVDVHSINDIIKNGLIVLVDALFKTTVASFQVQNNNEIPLCERTGT